MLSTLLIVSDYDQIVLMNFCEYLGIMMNHEKSFIVFSTSVDNGAMIAGVLNLPNKSLPI